MTDQRISQADQQRIAVQDYISEHAIAFPHHADADGHIRPSVYRSAIAAIPDEFHPRGIRNARDRFFAAAIAEANSRKADPYHVAEFAFDIVA